MIKRNDRVSAEVDRTWQQAPGLERQTAASTKHQTARFAARDPCGTGCSQELGGLKRRFRQLRDLPAYIDDGSLNVNRSRGAQGRRRGDCSCEGHAAQQQVREDRDVAAWAAKGIGVNPAVIQD